VNVQGGRLRLFLETLDREVLGKTYWRECPKRYCENSVFEEDEAYDIDQCGGLLMIRVMEGHGEFLDEMDFFGSPCPVIRTPLGHAVGMRHVYGAWLATHPPFRVVIDMPGERLSTFQLSVEKLGGTVRSIW